MEYYLVIKKNEIMPFAATGMNLKITILSLICQRYQYISYAITYMWNPFFLKDTNELIYKTERNINIENNLKVTKEEMSGWRGESG